MFVTGPDVVAATTGEKVTLDELGGAAIHNFQSGVAHHMADTEEEAIDYVRSLLDYLPSSCEVDPPKYDYVPNPEDEPRLARSRTWCPPRCASPTTCATWCVRSSTR